MLRGAAPLSTSSRRLFASRHGLSLAVRSSGCGRWKSAEEKFNAQEADLHTGVLPEGMSNDWESSGQALSRATRGRFF